MLLQNINPFLNYYHHKLTKYGLLGLSLTLCALILFAFNLGYQQKKLILIKHELIDLTAKREMFNQQNPSIKLPLVIDGAMDMTKESELPNALEFIFVAAKQNNLVIENADYKLTDLPSIQSRSYEINLPIGGKYLDIRNFIHQIIQNGNGVVLSNVELSREDSKVNDIDGLLQLIIYMKN